MTVVNRIQIVPRILVSGSLRVARLPVTVVERVARQQDNRRWPPALAYESLEASIETVLGSLLRDDVLVDKGQVRRAKVAQLRKAAELRTLAAQERARAGEQHAERRDEIADQRAETAQRAEQRKQEVVRQARVDADKVNNKAAKKASASRQVKAAQDKVITRQERTAKAGALKAESRALSTAKKAVDADETVDVIDATIEGSKAARKSS
jgi:hypothetical protein